jgi:hypothetical protein
MSSSESMMMMTQEGDEELSFRKDTISSTGHGYSFPSPDLSEIREATVVLLRDDVIPCNTSSNLLINGLFVSDTLTVSPVHHYSLMLLVVITNFHFVPHIPLMWCENCISRIKGNGLPSSQLQYDGCQRTKRLTEIICGRNILIRTSFSQTLLLRKCFLRR